MVGICGALIPNEHGTSAVDLDIKPGDFEVVFGRIGDERQVVCNCTSVQLDLTGLFRADFWTVFMQISREAGMEKPWPVQMPETQKRCGAREFNGSALIASGGFEQMVQPRYRERGVEVVR